MSKYDRLISSRFLHYWGIRSERLKIEKVNQMPVADKMNDFVESIKRHQEFIRLNYFLRSMKKMPHGGVIGIGIPNCFMRHYSPFEALRVLINHSGIEKRFVFEKSACIAKLLMEHFSITFHDLLFYICDHMGDCIWWYLSCCLIFPEDRDSSDCMADVTTVIDQKSIDGTGFLIKNDELLILFLCVLSHLSPYDNLEAILQHECLETDCDKYGLSDITKATFSENGFIIDNRFYVYNVFFDISIGNPLARVPLLIELMKSIDAVSIFMRRDNTIALDASMAYTVATADFQVFRGTTFNIKKMDIRRKNEIVRYNPETMNKLYLSVTPMESEKPEILSLVVEELWSPDSTDDSIMTTNFIHATYNVKTECIEHMDHSINEYSNLSRYRDKHLDTSARTGIPIDAYADKHYKIWYLKAPSMCLEDWYKITFASLDEPFRPLFDEMFVENA